MYPGTSPAEVELRTKGTVGGAPPRGQTAAGTKAFYSCMNAALPYGVNVADDCRQAKMLLGPTRNCARLLGEPTAMSGFGEMNSLLDIYEGAAGLGAGPGAFTYQPGTFRLSSGAMQSLLAARPPRTYADGATGTGSSEMPMEVKVAAGVGILALLGVVYMAVK